MTAPTEALLTLPRGLGVALAVLELAQAPPLVRRGLLALPVGGGVGVRRPLGRMDDGVQNVILHR